MNVTVLTVAMGLVLTYRALTFVPALLAISSTWIGNYVSVQFSMKNISATAQRHWAWIHGVGKWVLGQLGVTSVSPTPPVMDSSTCLQMMFNPLNKVNARGVSQAVPLQYRTSETAHVPAIHAKLTADTRANFAIQLMSVRLSARKALSARDD